MKPKSQREAKRGEETAKLLVSSRQTVFKEKYPIPSFTRATPRTSKHILGLHFEFPDTERNSSLSRVTSSHRRVSSTETTHPEGDQSLLRAYTLMKSVFPNLPDVHEGGDKSLGECIEAGIVFALSHLKSKEQEVEQLSTQLRTLTPQLQTLEQQKRLLSGQEEELRQARIALDQAREEAEQTLKVKLEAIEKREEAAIQREKANQSALNQLEKERITLTTACAKMRKRAKGAETQVKKLQALQSETARCTEVQTRLKNIVKQESLLNAVAEDLQYQRSSLLARLETTLTEIAPGQDADSSKANISEELCGDFTNPLRDCSNSLSSRERPKSKSSTQRLYRTLSRERPVDITEIYSEIEASRHEVLDVTPKGVLTPKSLRSSMGCAE